MRAAPPGAQALAIALVAFVTTACAAAPAAPSPTLGRAASPSASPAAPVTLRPTLAVTLGPTTAPTTAPTAMEFPIVSDIELEPGRYSSSPPFDLAFTFEVPADEGWHSAHLHGEFLDIIRFDDTGSRVPHRWLAWAHPTTIHGASSAPAAGLDAAQMLDRLASNTDLEATSQAPFRFAGLEGVQIDVTPLIASVELFGGPAGDFVLQSDHVARVSAVTVGDEPLLVMLMAPPGELNAAWTETAPILDSVELLAP